jgi:ketosteroid isomerase-like protein
VPDFRSELVASSVDGDIEWGEWDWQGHHVDGSAFAMRGVTILVLHDGLISQGRLYMEPVEGDGGDIEAAVRELYKPPPVSPH